MLKASRQFFHLPGLTLFAASLGAMTFMTPLSANPTAAAVTVLYQGAHCGRDAEALVWISDPQQLAAMGNQAAPAPDLPAIGTGESALFLLSIGSRPTPGYGVMPMAAPGISSDDTSLTIPMRWLQPPEGMMLSQVITTPCLLFSVPDSGFAQLQLVDQDGKKRLSASRPGTPSK